jgi:hypothetical protein
LQKIWDLAKDLLTTEEIKNNLLFYTDRKRKTVWHRAARFGSSDLLQKIWNMAKDILTTKELINNLLLYIDFKE